VKEKLGNETKSRYIRVWDYLLALDGEPDRVIVHSHDFNRYLTPFRAEWDPKDPDERIIVCGRSVRHPLRAIAAVCAIVFPQNHSPPPPKSVHFMSTQAAVNAPSAQVFQAPFCKLIQPCSRSTLQWLGIIYTLH